MANRRKKIGLALGGGFARGLAHIGVLRVLAEAKVPIDYIAGTSMGALVGGYYAATGDTDGLVSAFRRLKRKDILPLKRLIGKRDGETRLFGTPSFIEDAQKNLGSKRIENCRTPFAAVATDAASGEAVILKSGKLSEAIRASTAFPLLLEPVQFEKRVLIDGALSNPVPADVVRKMGAEYVIAVDVSSRWLNVTNEPIALGKIPEVISDVLSAGEYQLARPALLSADFVLRPSVFEFGRLDFDRVLDIVSAGATEARRNVRAICIGAGMRPPEETPLERLIDFIRGRASGR